VEQRIAVCGSGEQDATLSAAQQHANTEQETANLCCRQSSPKPEEILMAEVNTLTKTVIQVLNDGARGFADLAEHLQNPEAKSFFLQESTNRASYAREVAAAAGVTEDVGGTVSGSAHRVWGDLKAKLGGGDHTLLETAEQGEDAAKKAYEEALESSDITGSLRSVLQKQQPSIQASHDKVKALRDASK
jgi:uncharacterized protein (TIGR02284 family)